MLRAGRRRRRYSARQQAIASGRAAGRQGEALEVGHPQAGGRGRKMGLALSKARLPMCVCRLNGCPAAVCAHVRPPPFRGERTGAEPNPTSRPCNRQPPGAAARLRRGGAVQEPQSTNQTNHPQTLQPTTARRCAPTASWWSCARAVPPASWRGWTRSSGSRTACRMRDLDPDLALTLAVWTRRQVGRLGSKDMCVGKGRGAERGKGGRKGREGGGVD